MRKNLGKEGGDVAEEKIGFLVKVLSKWYRERPWWQKERDPYSLLVGILLANRTNYSIRRKYLPYFLRRFPSLEALLQAREEELEEALRPFGLYKLRARMLRELARKITELGGLRAFLSLEPGRARELLLSVPGVGEKTADIILAALFGENVFVVDTHILRIAKRLGIVPSNSDIYKARRIMEPLIPRDKRIQVHLALIQLGREVCKPRRPRCSECPLRPVCEYAAKETTRG